MAAIFRFVNALHRRIGKINVAGRHPGLVAAVAEGAGVAVLAHLHTEGAGEGDGQKVTGARIGPAALPHANGRHRNVPEQGILIHVDILIHPLHDGLGIAFEDGLRLGRDILQEPAFVRGEEFVFDAGGQDGFPGAVAVPEHLRGDIREVLSGKGAKEGNGAGLVIGLHQEAGDDRAVSAGALHQGDGLGGKRVVLHELQGEGSVRESGHISLAHGVFVGHFAVVEGTEIRCHFRQHHPLGRRDDVHQLRDDGRTHGAVQRYVHLRIRAEADAGKAVGPVLGRPGQHIPQAGRQRGLPRPVRVLGNSGEKLRGVVDAELHAGVLNSLAAGVHHPDGGLGALGIIADEVDFRVTRGAKDHLFGTVIFAEDLGMGEHRAGGGSVEPAQVQHRLGFASTQEAPAAVGPGFHPGVVAFGVGPARGIYLAGRDAYAAEGRHAEGGFLAASAQGILEGSQRGVRPAIGGLVGHLLVAPVVHLQDGFLHRQSLHAGLEHPVEHHAGAVQVFVVHAKRQHEVAKLTLGHLPAHFLAGFQAGTHVLQIEIGRIIRDIGQRHIGVEKLQRLPFRGRYPFGKGHERLQRAALRLHPGDIIIMKRIPAAGNQQQEYHSVKKVFHSGEIRKILPGREGGAEASDAESPDPGDPLPDSRRCPGWDQSFCPLPGNRKN